MLRVVVWMIGAAMLLSLLYAAAPRSQALQSTQERKAIQLDPRVYDAYVGRYELAPTFIITITREANGLALQATDQPKFQLFAESETKFFLKVVDAQISFVKNEKGEVTHLILHQNGVDQRARKIAATDKPPASPAAAATPAAGPPPLDLPVEMMVPMPPTPFRGDGKIHLSYELHLTNFSPRELTLARLEVLSSDGKPIAEYEGKDLNDRLARPGVTQNTEKQKLGGGLRAVAFLWLTFDAPSALPATLRHRLTTKMNVTAEGKTSEAEIKGEGAEIKLRNAPPPIISPPLRGDGWLAANGPSNTSVHRRALIPTSGAAHIAQRFAIDWVQLRDTGQTFTGDQLKNENYRCYGAEALAVADGTVVAIKDGIPQNIPGATSRAVPITLETIGGNHVILDLGSGYFAFYAHLQPGSLRVKVGDQVKRGQVLGLVGNSGNSTEPHLHFHISNANSPLGSEGLPYQFESFEVQGKGWGWKPSDKDTVEKRQWEMPMENAIVRFPTAR